MPSRINHLAIVSDHYTLLGMFYRAVFGMRVSGDTARESLAISVGDGYVGMTLIPRPSGRHAGLDHFGIEVEDLDLVRAVRLGDGEGVWRTLYAAVRDGDEQVPFIQEFMDTARALCFSNLSGIRRAAG